MYVPAYNVISILVSIYKKIINKFKKKISFNETMYPPTFVTDESDLTKTVLYDNILIFIRNSESLKKMVFVTPSHHGI